MQERPPELIEEMRGVGDRIKDGAALKCDQCYRVYPIKDDIPVMLIDEATIEENDD